MWTYLVVVAVLCLIVYFKKSKYIKLTKQFKNGYKTIPFFARLFFGTDEDLMHAIRIAGEDAIERNGAICITMVHRVFLVVADAEMAQFLLKTCLEKDDVMKLCFKMFIGNGGITAPVHIWQPRRKIMMPYFNLRTTKQFVQVFAQQARNTVGSIHDIMCGQKFSIFNYIRIFTLSSIFETTLGMKIKGPKDGDQILEKLDKALNIIIKRAFLPWLHYDFIFKMTRDYKTLIDVKNFCDYFTEEMLQFKRQSIETRHVEKYVSIEEGLPKSLLDRLIESDGGKLKYSNVELKEEFIVLIEAGTDTSAISISFALIMMARHPDVQEKVYAELKTVLGNTTRLLEAEDLPKLKYLELVIKETLRLYPAVPIVLRQVDRDVTLPSKVTVPCGCGVVFHIWALHCNPRYWGADADQFRPERFLQPLTHPAQFIPFSDGPRNCAGPLYAMAAMKTMLATFLWEYRVLPTDQYQPLRLKYKLFLKDADDFQVVLERRPSLA